MTRKGNFLLDAFLHAFYVFCLNELNARHPKKKLRSMPTTFLLISNRHSCKNVMIQGSSWSHYICLQVTWWSKVWFQSEMLVRNLMIQLHCDSVVMCKTFQHDENATAKPFWLFQCCFVAIDLSYKRWCNEAAYLCNTKVWKCFLLLGFQNHYKIYGTLFLVFLSEQQLITVQELHFLAPPSLLQLNFPSESKTQEEEEKTRKLHLISVPVTKLKNSSQSSKNVHNFVYFLGWLMKLSNRFNMLFSICKKSVE